MPRGRLSAKKHSAKKRSASRRSAKKRSASRRSASRRSASTRFRGETGLTPETNTSPTLAKKIRKLTLSSLATGDRIVVEFDLNRTAGELLRHVTPYYADRKLFEDKKVWKVELTYSKVIWDDEIDDLRPPYKWDNEDNNTKLSDIIVDEDENPKFQVWYGYEQPLFRIIKLSRMSTDETRFVKFDLNRTVGEFIEEIRPDYGSRPSEPLQELEEIQLVHLDKNLENDRRLSEYIDAEEKRPLILVREIFKPRDRKTWMSWLGGKRRA